ncbi:transposase [Verrucomicrobiaceae bacterium 5K15]|uniref:Transposase n=1 Tax=Oceaniferula flava TaxID=2800421 RepID=A0AAE2VF11_9BACT|nr:transposase [Oceaniferula flavus]MBK1856469.1 transposase [Oceaniferula flavus]MBM1137776.1 transposase [Oceaniferula flavus]
MRQPRFISPMAETDSSLYHCISRVVDRQFILGRVEKDMFVQIMRQYETFCGVRVLSYCIMSNHFHLLVEVPPKKKGEAIVMDDTEFLRCIKPLYSKAYYIGIEQMLERFRADGADNAAEELKAKYTCRMHDLSEFMKGLKQKFTQWYNGAKARCGTLWEGRFKSVLVEDGYAARIMCAYIDLNPVRAGMVAKPEDYKWCSYAEAMQPKGNQKARGGICRVLVGADAFDQQADELRTERLKQLDEGAWDEGFGERYRTLLFADGEEAFAEEIHSGEMPERRKSRRVRKGFQRKEVEKVLGRGGKLTVGEMIRCRVRYFSDGMAFGSKTFVENVFREVRNRFGAKRQSGARAMRGVGWQSKKLRLYSMRELRKDLLGSDN